MVSDIKIEFYLPCFVWTISSSKHIVMKPLAHKKIKNKEPNKCFLAFIFVLCIALFDFFSFHLNRSIFHPKKMVSDMPYSSAYKFYIMHRYQDKNMDFYLEQHQQTWTDSKRSIV